MDIRIHIYFKELSTFFISLNLLGQRIFWELWECDEVIIYDLKYMPYLHMPYL